MVNKSLKPCFGRAYVLTCRRRSRERSNEPKVCERGLDDHNPFMVNYLVVFKRIVLDKLGMLFI